MEESRVLPATGINHTEYLQEEVAPSAEDVRFSKCLGNAAVEVGSPCRRLPHDGSAPVSRMMLSAAVGMLPDRPLSSVLIINL
jgi:hypothetical protein